MALVIVALVASFFFTMAVFKYAQGIAELQRQHGKELDKLWSLAAFDATEKGGGSE